jgi:hypothetical protein
MTMTELETAGQRIGEEIAADAFEAGRTPEQLFAAMRHDKRLAKLAAINHPGALAAAMSAAMTAAFNIGAAFAADA